MPDEPWTLPDSSAVAGFRRAGPNGGNLEVWFRNGKRYEYIGAGALEPAMAAAPSKGVFLNKEVKPFFLYNRL